jgi:hypothetical protein
LGGDRLIFIGVVPMFGVCFVFVCGKLCKIVKINEICVFSENRLNGGTAKKRKHCSKLHKTDLGRNWEVTGEFELDVFFLVFWHNVKSSKSEKSVFFRKIALRAGNTKRRKTVQNCLKASWDGIGK